MSHTVIFTKQAHIDGITILISPIKTPILTSYYYSNSGDHIRNSYSQPTELCLRDKWKDDRHYLINYNVVHEQMDGIQRKFCKNDLE